MNELSNLAEEDSHKYALRHGLSYKCENYDCENYVPSGRKRYCSDECGVIANRKKNAQRENRDRESNFIYQLQRKNRKKRVCLKCNKVFMSNGSWNRICLECSERNTLVTKRQGRLRL